MAGRVLFVVPPWLAPNMSSLAVATLAPILRARGVEVDELHGSALFPRTHNDVATLESFSKFLFVRALNGTPLNAVLEQIRAVHRESITLGGIVDDEAGAGAADAADAEFAAGFAPDIAAAEACLARMVELALARPYDAVLFSTTFDTQVPAALAMARALKQRRPALRIALGGAACLEEQGDGLLRSFAELDVVCHTEGEAVIGPLIDALAGALYNEGALASALAAIPGICWRDGDQVRHNPSPPPNRDMDALPIPDYGPFVAQFTASAWAAAPGPLHPRLLFETSRGCWWGQKSLCTFCGLNGEGLAFRSKSPARAFDEIRHLYTTYQTATFLQSTDNILDLEYLTTVMPRLAALPREPDRPLRIFYEVKSNMRPEQVEAMAEAGVVCVQPGIESFSTDVLKLMRKGCTALGQIQFIKWCDQAGISPVYNIILRNPGEQVAWYRQMLALLPALHHLSPPSAVVPMLLERFSPYFMHPDEFGITNVRPKPFYRALYDRPGVDFERVAYQFAFDHPVRDDAELAAVHRACVAEIKQWQASWTPDQLYYEDRGAELRIVDARRGAPDTARLAGPPAELFRYLDSHRARAGIAAQFPRLDAALLDTLLLAWTHRGWLCGDGDRVVSVVPRKGPAFAQAKPEVVPPKRQRATLPIVTSVAG